MNISKELTELVRMSIEAGGEVFAADLKARIEAVIAFGRSGTFTKEDVFQLIDETMNAVHPTEEQIREAERGELP